MNIEKREIDGKTRTVGTIEIDWNDKKENVELIALSFGEDLRIRNKCTKVKMATGTPDVLIDQEKMTLMNLKKSIIKAPFEITEDNIFDLEKRIASDILTGFNELNTPQEKKNLN